MTVELHCEVGQVQIGDRRVSAGCMLKVTLADLPIEVTAGSALGDWRALIKHVGTSEDPVIEVAVMYGEPLGERYTLTPAGLSRFGCSVVVDGEAGDRVVITSSST